MNSKEIILAAIKTSQPDKVELPDISVFEAIGTGSMDKFAAMLEIVGGKISYVTGYEEIERMLIDKHGTDVRVVTGLKNFRRFSPSYAEELLIHELQDVEVAILSAGFGVAENGAVWLTETDMLHRVLPFVCQHLVILLSADQIISTMHQAYDLISKTTYGFGTFMAGPSKTADIEQSLVIGAHGPRSLTIFMMLKENSQF